MKTLTCCVWFLLIWLSVPPVHAATGAEAEFVRAYRHYSEGDHSRAKTLFQSALADATLVLGDYALYYLGRIASKAGKHDEAQDYFTRLKKSYPKSIWVSEALLRVGRTRPGPEALSGSRPRRRCAEGEAVGKGGPGESRALPRAGARSPGQGPRSLRLPPGGAPACAPLPMGRPRPGKGSGAFGRDHPEQLTFRNADAMLREARQLQRERDYPAAADLYRRVLRETNFRRLSLEGLAEVYRKMRQRDREEQVSAGTSGTIHNAHAPARRSRGSPPSSGIATTTPGRWKPSVSSGVSTPVISRGAMPST